MSLVSGSRTVILYSNSQPTSHPNVSKMTFVPISPFCAEALDLALREHISPAKIITVTDPANLSRLLDSSDLHTLVIPGGNAFGISFSLKNVKSKMNAAIDSGRLNYLGSCAGAMYATQGWSNWVPFNSDITAFKPKAGGQEYQGVEKEGRVVTVDSPLIGRFKSFWNMGSLLQKERTSALASDFFSEVLASYLKTDLAAFDTMKENAAVFQTIPHRFAPASNFALIGFHPELYLFNSSCRDADSGEADLQNNRLFLEDAFRRVEIISSQDQSV